MFVRLALEDDFFALMELGRQASELGTPHLTFSDERFTNTYRGYLDECDCTFFVVEDKRELIGFMLATISEYRHAAGLYTTQEVMFVRPDKRGTRAAALLVKNLVEWSHRLGAIEITGGNDNKFKSDKMVRFLGRFGFEHVGCFMRRVLTDG